MKGVGAPVAIVGSRQLPGALVSIDDRFNLVLDLIGFVEFWNGLLWPFDDPLVGDGDEDLDRAMLETALDEPEEFLSAKFFLVIDKQLAKQCTLAACLLDWRWHPRPLASEHTHKLELRVDMYLAGDALGLDDDYPVLVEDEMVDLGDLALTLYAEIIEYADIRVVCVAPTQVERHLLLGSVASLLHPVSTGA